MGDRGVKILAIDDNPDNLIILNALIQESFSTAMVLMATSGQQGLDFARREDPDVVILDILMPVMDGYEVCRRLKADHLLRDIPVVFITAMKGESTSRILALECGAEAFLSKPIDEIELTAQIRAMLKIKYLNVQKRSEKERLNRLIEEKTQSLQKEILERHQIELNLRLSEEKYRLIAENISDVIWVLNLSLKKLTYISPSIQRLRGISVQEALAEKLNEALAPHSVEKVRQVIAEHAKAFMSAPEGSHYHTMEVQQPCKNGELVWTEVSASYRLNAWGEIEIVGISRNIEERKKIIQELLEAKHRAEDANVAKSRFLANMSHEIRTPLNGLMGSLQLLEMTPLTMDQSELIDVSNQSARGLLRVINDILDYSKIEARQIRIEAHTFSLDDFMDELEKIFLPSAFNKGINLVIQFEGNVPRHIKADSFRLRQVLSNLIGNAIKFTHKGSVVVSVKVVEIKAEKFKLQWSVMDTGIGLNEDIFEHIFESFSQADESTTRKYGGTGLGLSICKSLVELMGGEIGVESIEGVGSRFFFTSILEKVESEDSIVVSETTDVTTSDSIGGLKVLIVEDDEISRIFIKRFAKLNGWYVVFAENGEESVEIFEKDVFDVILMDIQMSGVDGLQATRRIRDLEKLKVYSTPIIAMTANALKGDREKCLEAGMNDYITKPIEIKELKTLVEKWALVKRMEKFR
jgi:PAS domain S-box-containing protein